MRRDRRLMLVALTGLALGACDFYYNEVPSPDDLMHAVPWFDHMIRQRYVHPYSRADIPRLTIEGTVPVTGGQPDWSAEWATGNTTTADRLTNPIASATTRPMRAGPEVAVIPATVEARGDTLYGTFCATCHGETGGGDGLVGRRMGAPAITTDRAKALSDGYLYSIIRYGRGVMPRYGDKIYADVDRWAVVSHVRRLQGIAPAAAPAPAAGAAPAGAVGGTN